MTRLGQKALLLLTVLTMLAASLPGIADAAAKKESTRGKDATPAKSKPTTDFAKGKGTVAVDGQGSGKFEFNATATQSGGTVSNPAKGKFSILISGIQAKGKVQCLVAENEQTGGAAADFVGPIKKTNTPEFKGKFADFEVFDSGQPNGEGDLINVPVSDSATCHPPTVGGLPLKRGNIVVQSTTPAT